MEWIAQLYQTQSIIISWLISLTGIMLLILPTVSIWKLCKANAPQWRFTLSFMVFGALAIPLSFFLYFQFYLDPIRALIFGFLGLLMTLVHMMPFEIASTQFLLEATDATSGRFGEGVSIHFIQGGLFWLLIYGAIGFCIDLLLKLKKNS